MVSFEVSNSHGSPPTNFLRVGILRDHLKIQVKPKIRGGGEMNTVDLFLASVEFGDGPFAPANMIKIKRFLVCPHLPRGKFKDLSRIY
jgi:hypothetical protein